MSQDLKDFLDRASRAPHAPHDPLPAIYRRHRRHRRRVIAGSTAAALAAALVVGGLAAVSDLRGPVDPAQGVRTVSATDITVSVPDGWTVDETTQGCATTPRTIMVLRPQVADDVLGNCLYGRSDFPADLDLDTFEPKHHEASSLPVAYVLGDDSASTTNRLMWSADDLVLGARSGEDVDPGSAAAHQVDIFTGGAIAWRAPRAKGIGSALVLARTLPEAESIMDELDPRFLAAANDGLLDPPEPVGQGMVGFSFTPREPGIDGGAGYFLDTADGPGPRVPGTVVDGSVAAAARDLLVGLEPARAVDARCLLVRTGDVDRLAPGTSSLWIQASVERATPVPPRASAGFDIYQAWIGTSDCPYVVDNWGGIAKRPPDLLNQLAELTLSPENLALFRQEWGPQGP